jgi:hypothetical protein
VPRTNPTNPNEVTLGTFAASPAGFPTFICHQMETLIINTHLTYPGWSEGKLNLALMELAKTFFVEHGHTVTA